MDTIRTYLENMFLHLPKNPEVRRAKEELLSMMEDKYQELKREGRSENEAIGIVISEFGNLEEIAEELGLTNFMHQENKRKNLRVISKEDASHFMENREKASYKVALGVVMVAIAVGLFILSGVEYGRYDLDKNADFTLDFQAETYLRNEEERNRLSMAIKIIIGVVVCIVSVLPLILLGILDVRDEMLIMAVALLLFLVGSAVFLFVLAGSQQSSMDILLKKGEYSMEARKRSKKAETIGSIYWPLIVLVYLYWSFTSGLWGFTWIIWPLAGLLFAAMVGVTGLISKEEKNE
ncbi:permease prefix domain 1-containing protein [Proteiniclasticum ruminis]|uniref:permease prefix domain 1-containing protein n=1 Tax=Proteiniclasticum ruminis TaxID=398199 RepID=UPI0028AB7DF6|nr:permease prefix domain 1-containing protein [Proteiniclasticum ruminis]